MRLMCTEKSELYLNKGQENRVFPKTFPYAFCSQTDRPTDKIFVE